MLAPASWIQIHSVRKKIKICENIQVESYCRQQSWYRVCFVYVSGALSICIPDTVNSTANGYLHNAYLILKLLTDKAESSRVLYQACIWNFGPPSQVLYRQGSLKPMQAILSILSSLRRVHWRYWRIIQGAVGTSLLDMHEYSFDLKDRSNFQHLPQLHQRFFSVSYFYNHSKVIIQLDARNLTSRPNH